MTTCEYSINISPKVVFLLVCTFSWVYINGITAIELGGLHPRAIQAIDLSNPRAAEYLNIVPGGIYTFDL